MRPRQIPAVLATALALVASAALLPAPAGAQLSPPWDGNPISPGLGPTYGEAWCAAPSGSIAAQQGPPLALIPYEAIECTLQQFEAEAAANGVPDRLDYSVIGESTLGRDLLGVVVNALETPGQLLLQSWGQDVKLPIFIEANIHGGEEEGTDAMMQVIRDLVTLPYGTNDVVDAVLDHAILVVIPTANPDGRTAGTRANNNGFDMNRDLLVQSQPEIRANTALQLEWLAPVGLFMHGYVNPTLVDGLTKPHNPGLEYDVFLYWNQRRLDANEAAVEAIGSSIQRPVNDWNMDADTAPPPVGPPYAEGWDDWGPFYTQTYGAFFGVDGSTTEMCSFSCGGRLGGKGHQYLLLYSSADFWIENRQQILHDQLEIFRRGGTHAARPNCCADPLLTSRQFTEDQHNWMVEYPTAFVIPFVRGGAGHISPHRGVQRSDAEANRMAQWLLDNDILVERTTRDLTWQGRTFPNKSYVVWMDQAFRGLAYTSASAGPMPAGSLIFDAATAPALGAAGLTGGFFFERGVGPKPPTSQLDEAPRVAILVNSANPSENDQSWSLRQIFGPDVGFVSVVNGTNSLQNALADPLETFDVIYNTGQNFPSATNATARARLTAFFQRGGGYIGTSQSANNFNFLNTAVPALITGTLTQSTDAAGGGIARWSNTATGGPLTGGFPATDNLYLPSNITWFSSIPTGAVVNGRYLPSLDDMFVAGLWRDRNPDAANAPMVVHGTTPLRSRD